MPLRRRSESAASGMPMAIDGGRKGLDQSIHHPNHAYAATNATAPASSSNSSNRPNGSNELNSLNSLNGAGPYGASKPGERPANAANRQARKRDGDASTRSQHSNGNGTSNGNGNGTSNSNSNGKGIKARYNEAIKTILKGIYKEVEVVTEYKEEGIESIRRAFDKATK